MHSYARGEVCAKIQRSTKRFACATLAAFEMISDLSHRFTLVVPSAAMLAAQPYLKNRQLLPSGESDHR